MTEDGAKSDGTVLEGEVIGEPSTADAPADEATRKRSLGLSVPWVLVAALAVFIAGLFAAPYAMIGIRAIAPGLADDPAPAVPAWQAEVESLETTLDSLTRRVAAAEAAVAQAYDQSDANAAALGALETRLTGLPSEPADAPDLTGLEEAVSALVDRIVRLEAAPVAGEAGPGVVAAEPAVTVGLSEFEDRLASIAERIAALEAEQTAGRAEAAKGFAVAALVRRVELGAPFTVELAAARTFIPAEARPARVAAADLARDASQGLARRDALIRAFPELASAAYRAHRKPPEDAGWWAWLWARISGLVVVRPAGDVAGEDAAALLARAEHAIAEGRLGDAAELVGKLTGPAGETLASWHQRAARHLQARDRLDTLIDAILTAPVDMAAEAG